MLKLFESTWKSGPTTKVVEGEQMSLGLYTSRKLNKTCIYYFPYGCAPSSSKVIGADGLSGDPIKVVLSRLSPALRPLGES